jgi:hypothetical protein
MSLIARRLQVVACLVIVAAVTACGGSSSSSPTAPTTPTVTQAKITVTAAAPTISISPLANFNYRIVVPVTVTESAGLGANINFIRLSQIFGGAEIERQEISASGIVAQTGSNRLAAGSTRNFNLTYDVNDGRATSGQLDFNFTDDRSNTQDAFFTLTY